MTSQKMILFDIDGTLLNDDKELPVRTEHSIQKLKEKGHIIALATGRAPFSFKDLRQRLDIASYVSLNGQYVVFNNKVIYKKPLHLPALKELIAYAEKRSHPLLYANDENWRSNIKRNAYIEGLIDALKVPYDITFESPPDDADENYQALLFCEANDDSFYKKHFEQFEFVRWHNYTVDVLPKGGSKAIGIERLMTAAEENLENVYAFGDGLNDIEMLEYIPNSVAMGNALKPVKQAAKFVTTTVDDDGILYGLKKVGLLSR